MDISTHTTSSNLERYAFYWLIALLVFSAGALFLGAKLPITLITGYSSTVWSLLNLSWLLCGASAIYLTYQWIQHKKEVFGGKDMKDTVAFVLMLAAGFNLGITGALGTNIYFEVIMGQFMFTLTGIVCLVAAGYLYKRWQGNGQTLFSAASPVPQTETMSEANNSDGAYSGEEKPPTEDTQRHI